MNDEKKTSSGAAENAAGTAGEAADTRAADTRAAGTAGKGKRKVIPVETFAAIVTEDFALESIESELRKLDGCIYSVARFLDASSDDLSCNDMVVFVVNASYKDLIDALCFCIYDRIVFTDGKDVHMDGYALDEDGMREPTYKKCATGAMKRAVLKDIGDKYQYMNRAAARRLPYMGDFAAKLEEAMKDDAPQEDPDAQEGPDSEDGESE